jgi:hypothetical protein
MPDALGPMPVRPIVSQNVSTAEPTIIVKFGSGGIAMCHIPRLQLSLLSRTEIGWEDSSFVAHECVIGMWASKLTVSLAGRRRLSEGVRCLGSRRRCACRGRDWPPATINSTSRPQPAPPDSARPREKIEVKRRERGNTTWGKFHIFAPLGSGTSVRHDTGGNHIVRVAD